MASPSPARTPQATAPLWLKVLVIVMSVLIVVGFIVVAAELARRISSPSTLGSPATSTSTGPSFAERITLPSGAQVVAVGTTADRITVHVRSVDGRSTLYILDPRNGALLGTVDFPSGAVR
ncbi:MAG: hypothetical protein KIS73_15425 [Enhydrobacter sp.]|nr:hypothetical protein [Enhydrobacter sp.]